MNFTDSKITEIYYVVDNFCKEFDNNLSTKIIGKPTIIETINDVLKNTCQVEHSRHRSFDNFISNLLAGIATYCFLPKKPNIRFDNEFDFVY